MHTATFWGKSIYSDRLRATDRRQWLGLHAHRVMKSSEVALGTVAEERREVR